MYVEVMVLAKFVWSQIMGFAAQSENLVVEMVSVRLVDHMANRVVSEELLV